MTSQNLEQRQTFKIQPSMTQTYVMQQADLLQMSDFDFHKLISELEKDPLFEKLYHQEKLIRYRRYAGADINTLSFDIEKFPVSGSSYPDIEAVIAKYPDILEVIRELGDEKFKRYFLLPQENYLLEEIATECNISVKEIHVINSLVNELSILSTFYHPHDSGPQMLSYTCLASIRLDREGFLISYLSPVYARGRYVIDYEKLEIFLQSNTIDKRDISGVRKLLKKLELINNRKNILQNILSTLINKQSLYLKNGKQDNLLPFSQKELAREIGVAPSSVSRTIRTKSIITPWDEEIPLKYLLPNLHMFKKELVKRILETEPALKSDEAIHKKIRDNFGAHISRRSISAIRRELGIDIKGNG
jgi:DNA-directed RNA polymerase specialized sigma54-like protein